MVPTELKKEFRGIFPGIPTLILICLAVLPYVSYAALIGFLGLTVWWVGTDWKGIGRGLLRQGWGILAVGMVLSAIAADYPGEAALQLVNFLPFMVLFGGVATQLGQFASPVRVLESWIFVLLLGSIPINLRAIAEYYLKAPTVATQWANVPYLSWLYSETDYGHRADAVFGHPNVLAGYLVILFGLGLGLSWKFLAQRKPPPEPDKPQVPIWLRPSVWCYGATLLMPVGIFCSGSRNGVVVAIAQMLVFGWLLRKNRIVLMAGLAGVVAVLAGVIHWGIGGRSLGEAFSTSTLRFDVWQLALNLIQQDPWLGLGLGGFRLHYVPYSIPEYALVEHAHNLWLMLATELGIPLMLGFTLVVGMVCYRGLKSLIQKPFSPADTAVLTGYILGFMGATLFALFDLTFYDFRVNLLGWLVLAVIQAIPTLAPPECYPEDLW